MNLTSIKRYRTNVAEEDQLKSVHLVMAYSASPE